MAENTKQREPELGVFWIETEKNYDISGSITVNGEQIKFVGFKNKHKKPGEKTPDYRFFKRRELGQGGGKPQAAASTPKPAARKPAAAPAPQPVENLEL